MPTDSQDTRIENPPAFPTTVQLEVMDDAALNGYRTVRLPEGGMTLRDYFAAAVVPQAIEHEREIRSASVNKSAFRYELIAEAAYALADAMLIERAK